MKKGNRGKVSRRQRQKFTKRREERGERREERGERREERGETFVFGGGGGLVMG